MKLYKGFNTDMTCRGFQYAEGETYETDEAKLCEAGFHACEAPLDCFGYYAPAESVYHEVELDATDETSADDTKRVGKKITLGARLSIKNLVDAQIEYVREHCSPSKLKHTTEDRKYRGTRADRSANSSTGDMSANSSTGYRSANSSTGYMSANSSTGYMSANSSTGDMSANSSTGYMSANSSTGDMSANSSTGDRSANSSTGDRSANSSTGDMSANSSTGDMSANSSTGYMSANSSTGDRSANSSTGDRSANSSTGYASINVGWGRFNRCKGALGNYLVLSEWGEWDGEKYPLLGAVMVCVDGEKVKPDTWYTLENGELTEVEG